MNLFNNLGFKPQAIENHTGMGRNYQAQINTLSLLQ